MLCPAWVDDLAVPILAPAALIAEKLQSAAACVHNAVTRFQLQMNLKVGDTEIIVAAYGPVYLVAQRFLPRFRGPSFPVQLRMT